MPPDEPPRPAAAQGDGDTEKRPGLGCAWAMASFNGLAMGLVAISFTDGPFYDGTQEFWYRWVSLAFVACGAVLPALALLLADRRPYLTAAGLLGWMIVVFLVFAQYLMVAGGGV